MSYESQEAFVQDLKKDDQERRKAAAAKADEKVDAECQAIKEKFGYDSMSKQEQEVVDKYPQEHRKDVYKEEYNRELGIRTSDRKKNGSDDTDNENDQSHDRDDREIERSSKKKTQDQEYEIG